MELHGSLPPGREFPKETMMDRLRYLQEPSIAQCVVAAIQQSGGSSYILPAWVVNPVHLLITPRMEVPKQFDAASQPKRDAFSGRSGDHLARNSKEPGRIENYIVQNPVRVRRFEMRGLKPAAG